MSDLIQMRTLVLVSELGSLAEASKRLGISAAAISKQLSRLEANLGLQLLNRSTRSVELTEMGKAYCEQCMRVLEEADAAEALISQIKTTPHGDLRVVSGRYFAGKYITPHIREFLKLFPEIQLDLELAERIPDFSLESIDVLIGMSISMTGNVIQKRILTTRYSICASPKYLKNFGTPKKPADMIKHRYITHSMRRPDNELHFSNKEMVKIKPYLRVNDADTMLLLAQEGLGIVKLHHYMVDQLIEKGELVELLHPFVKDEIPIYVAFPQRRYTSAKVRCFIDFLLKKISQHN
jgi:DNA-binding transcriptional LysR family regulator